MSDIRAKLDRLQQMSMSTQAHGLITEALSALSEMERDHDRGVNPRTRKGDTKLQIYTCEQGHLWTRTLGRKCLECGGDAILGKGETSG